VWPGVRLSEQNFRPINAFIYSGELVFFPFAAKKNNSKKIKEEGGKFGKICNARFSGPSFRKIRRKIVKTTRGLIV
jgi:hypothetical protein